MKYTKEAVYVVKKLKKIQVPIKIKVLSQKRMNYIPWNNNIYMNMKLIQFFGEYNWQGTFICYRIAKGMTVRGSNAGWGKIFRIRQDWPWVHPASYTRGTGSSRG
jgi:hypothetical protein